MDHDPRCEGLDDEQLLAGVAEYGWHVLHVSEKDGTPGWGFSIDLYKNFNHPEVVVFGLQDVVMQSIVNSIENARARALLESMAE